MTERKSKKKSARLHNKRVSGRKSVLERVNMDLGAMVITTDNFKVIQEQLVRSGRISGSRLTVRINGA